MASPKPIDLESLAGKQYTLKGCDLDMHPDKLAGIIRFTLGRHTYQATEDPQDGWRSSMDSIVLWGEPCKRTFPGIKVEARMRQPEYSHHVLELTLVGNSGRVILSVGTDNTDDYYPSWTAYFDESILR